MILEYAWHPTRKEEELQKHYNWRHLTNGYEEQKNEHMKPQRKPPRHAEDTDQNII